MDNGELPLYYLPNIVTKKQTKKNEIAYMGNAEHMKKND